MENWIALTTECEPLLGKDFIDCNGTLFRFFGLVWTDDDYYYGMFTREGKTLLLSCVGSLDAHGFVLATSDQRRKSGRTSPVRRTSKLKS